MEEVVFFQVHFKHFEICFRGVSDSIHTDASSEISMFEENRILIVCRFVLRERGKVYVPNYRLNIINPAEIEDLSGLEESLQMVFGMLKYRKDLKGLKTYVEKNRAYFSDIDEESYRAAKMMLGAESYWKDIKSEKENGGMDMCKALEDLRQEGIDIGVERGMKLGEERGVEQGVEIGVTRFIEAFQEMGMSYEDTVRKLQEKFNLAEEDVERKMKACWKIERLDRDYE